MAEKKVYPTFGRENELKKQGYNLIAGVDEAGLGPLAGPVVASAVVFDLDKTQTLPNIDDSKKLTEAMREGLFPVVYNTAISVGVGIVSVKTIDEINIYWAGRQAMIDAITNLGVKPDYILIDGNKPLSINLPQESIVKGDSKSLSIAAASIVAKVTRDRLMKEYDKQYPSYGFAQHKGYGTVMHRQKIKELGPCEIHRVKFKGVKEYI